ncbi:unnamed protein product [Litomosoides sigmodontis]|uniref:Uncharacterized protein n=1 Tax=Litomosoides sigmodontis TaxID=42156 RepID=A0A3P6U9W3_LITSI|nr:unnamed protein product [Litomosoides sigmodontis]
MSAEGEETWEDLIDAWSSYIKDIPRAVTNSSQSTTLHVFTDASSVAYVAAIYTVQEKDAHLIFAKCGSAPIKGATIPRLELTVHSNEGNAQPKAALSCGVPWTQQGFPYAEELENSVFTNPYLMKGDHIINESEVNWTTDTNAVSKYQLFMTEINQQETVDSENPKFPILI